jgi:hypothetical protein
MRSPASHLICSWTLVVSPEVVYSLSGVHAEFVIADRLSFMRFLGLGLSDRVADTKTFGCSASIF